MSKRLNAKQLATDCFYLLYISIKEGGNGIISATRSTRYGAYIGSICYVKSRWSRNSAVRTLEECNEDVTYAASVIRSESGDDLKEIDDKERSLRDQYP
jgi:hypothetical protein